MESWSVRLSVAALVAILALGVDLRAEERPAGLLYVDREDPDTAVLTYQTYGCSCENSCVYRASSPVGLIDPANDVSALGTFVADTWTEQSPPPGTIWYYARSVDTSVPPNGIAHQFSITLPDGGIPTSPVVDGAYVYQAAGNVVESLDSVTGGYLAAATLIGAVRRPPSVAAIDPDRTTNVYVATQGGFLHRLSAPGLASLQQRDLRRAACPSDELFASPVVQVRARSNAAFQSAVGEDLVFVGTRHGCGDTTFNQIVALRAGDVLAPPRWTFNVGDYEMDYVTGCTLDYPTNTLFCGSHRGSSVWQPTVWAISTLDGSLKWADNVGPVHGRPYPNHGTFPHLFVVNTEGTLFAMDLETGAVDWSLPLTSSSSPTEADVVAIAGGPWADLVFATDGDGVLHAVYDSGTIPGSGIEAWATSFPGGQKVVGAPAIFPGPGKAYVPLSDATLHQLNLASGTDEAVRTLCLAPTTGMVVPTPVLGPTEGGAAWIVGASSASTCGTGVKKFCVPWAYASSGS